MNLGEPFQSTYPKTVVYVVHEVGTAATVGMNEGPLPVSSPGARQALPYDNYYRKQFFVWRASVSGATDCALLDERLNVFAHNLKALQHRR